MARLSTSRAATVIVLALLAVGATAQLDYSGYKVATPPASSETGSSVDQVCPDTTKNVLSCSCRCTDTGTNERGSKWAGSLACGSTDPDIGTACKLLNSCTVCHVECPAGYLAAAQAVCYEMPRLTKPAGP